MIARAWFAVLALFFGGAGEAFAANANACNLTQKPSMEATSGHTFPTKTAAMARCRAEHYGGNLWQESVYAYTGGKRWEGTCKHRPSQGNRIQFNETRTEEWSTILKDGEYTCNPNTIVVTHAADSAWRGYYIYLTDDCPAPKVIDEAGQCVDAKARCMQKADAKGSSVELFTGTKCIDGCQYGKKNGGQSTSGGLSMIWGDIGFTGDTCSSLPPDPLKPPPPKERECVKPGGGLTMCIRKDGRHCYEASTGKEICWAPGETGTKTDANVAQARAPGANPPSPPTPPPGETFNDTNKNTTTNTTTPGGTSVTNTTNNYTTNFGTNAGPGNSGTPTDGSGGEEPGEGEDEGNGIGGDGSCEGGYLPSGDPVLGATLTELHRMRCLGDKGKADNTSDAGTLGGIGDDLEAQAMGEDRDGFIRDAGEGGDGINEGWVSFGSGSCPQFPDFRIPGTDLVWSAPAQFCTIGAALRALFILCAYVWALRIVSD